MGARLVFAALTLFWVIMNVLLWRMEYGDRSASSVPAAAIWERVLTAADSSSLQISHQGHPLGLVRWTPSVVAGGQEAVGADEPAAGLETMVRQTAGYRVDLDGSWQGDGALRRMRFNGFMELGTNHQWQEFGASIQFKPGSIEVSSKATDGFVRVAWRDGAASFDERIAWRDLANPGRWLGSFGLAVPPGLIPGAAWLNAGTNELASRMQWTARNDTLRVGGTRLRVFRVSARFLERYEAVVWISRAGEILRIDLPDRIRVVNTALPTR